MSLAAASPLAQGAQAPAPRTFDILGVPVSAIDLDAAVQTIEGWVAAGDRHYVCITGTHGLIESMRDPALRSSFDRAGLVTPDGMPLVWVARLRGLAHVGRVYGPDLMLRLSARTARPGLRHFYFGGADGVAERLKAALTQRNPVLDVVGTFTPPFRAMSEAEEDTLLAAIHAARPDILWIGLSTPKQDLWMARFRHRLEVPVMIGVGAAFDFLSGTKRQAPPWMRRNGLEWLFRVASEPRRLFGRYASIVPRFLLVLGYELARKGLPARSRPPTSEPSGTATTLAFAHDDPRTTSHGSGPMSGGKGE